MGFFFSQLYNNYTAPVSKALELIASATMLLGT